MADISLTVNGCSYSFPEIPNETLADLLRQRLHLTGTKIGCGEGHCGVCTVLLDGKPVKSCRIAASKAIGKNILTIEGLQALSPTPGTCTLSRMLSSSMGAYNADSAHQLRLCKLMLTCNLIPILLMKS